LRAGETAKLVEEGKRSKERGGARLKLLLTLFILGAMVYSAVEIVPAYVTNYQFVDALKSEVQFAETGYPKKTEDDIKDDIYKEAQKDGVPIKRDDIRTTINGNAVTIGVDYSVPVDLKVYQFALHFHCLADNHTI
jgi:hypothetical protein